MLAVLFLFTHLFPLPPYFLFVLFTLAILISLFFYEHYYKTNRFFKSIPIQPSKIILSRYITSLLFIIILIVSQIVFMMINSLQADTEFYFFYTWHDIIIVFSLGMILVSITTPIIHLFKSIYIAITLIGTLLLSAGFLINIRLVLSLVPDVSTAWDKLDAGEHIPNQTSSFVFAGHIDEGYQIIVERYLPGKPYVTLALTSIVLLVCSYFISVKLFKRKDLA